jgi:hypothetical protein
MTAQDLQFHDLLNWIEYTQILSFFRSLAGLNEGCLYGSCVDELAFIEMGEKEGDNIFMMLHNDQLRH